MGGGTGMALHEGLSTLAPDGGGTLEQQESGLNVVGVRCHGLLAAELRACGETSAEEHLLSAAMFPHARPPRAPN